MVSNGVPRLLEQFRANRRAFISRLDRTSAEDRRGVLSLDVGSASEIVISVAAWLDEANDRIPRLMAGAPVIEYDQDDFQAAALTRAEGWTFEQALGAFRRAADRFDMIIAESNADELASEPPVMRWIECLAGVLMEQHTAELDRLNADFDVGSTDR